MTENKKTLYLMDGYAFAYRAYYAFIRNPLINSKGFPTGAIFGFANYLLKLIESYGCPYVAVAMDSAVPTFRHEAYPQYKANREAMPDDLKLQMPRIFELVEAFNIPIVRRDGFEADDIIASLTKKAVDDGFDVVLVTKDKDLMQLIGDKVRMLAPEGFGVFQYIDAQDVVDKMGVPPSKVLDYLSMVGDSSDNIPGVPGIGPKGAAKILETASVDRLLEDSSLAGSPKLQAKFEEYKEQLRLSKMLATLRFDVEFDFDFEHLKRREFNKPKCLEMFRMFEFHSLIKNPMFDGGGDKFEPELHIVESSDELRTLVKRIMDKGEVAVDIILTEGDAPRAAGMVGIVLAIDKSEAFYVRAQKDSLKILADVIEAPHVGKIGHDLKTGSLALRRERLRLRGIVFDTMLAAYIISPGKRNYDLAGLASELLNLDIKAGDSNGDNNKNYDLFNQGEDDIDPRAAEVPCAALLLRDKLSATLEERNGISLLKDIELSLEPVLADLEWSGVLIDTFLLQTLSSQYTREMEEIAKEIYAFAGEEFNLNSPKQLGEILFGKLGLQGGRKTKSGARSTDVEVLEKLADDYPIVKKILDYREKQKLLSTYIDALPAQILPETGRVHTSFNQAITSTGRLSSTNPNLQNIPIRTESGRKIREAFTAPPGHMLVAADYSQIELRILAHLSCDPVLIQAFTDDADIHTQTASIVYSVFPEMVTPDMRRAAKTINFGLMYGMGPINLAKQLGVSFSEAKKFIESYFNQFPSIRKYMDESIQKVRDLGYSETLLGRRRYLPEINASNRNVREAAERTAINTPVQGTAADIIKLAMIRVHKSLDKEWPGTKMLLQVHDELVFETPEAHAEGFAKWVRDEMGAAYELKVPLKVDVGVGRHWGEAH